MTVDGLAVTRTKEVLCGRFEALTCLIGSPPEVYTPELVYD